jgi:hypothetical protein
MYICRGGGHEREISNAGRLKLDFTEIDQCKPVLLGLSLAGNLVNLFMTTVSGFFELFLFV